MSALNRRDLLAMAGVNVLGAALSRPAWSGGQRILSLSGLEQVYEAPLDTLPGRNWKSPPSGRIEWMPRYRFDNDPRGCSFAGEYQWYVDPAHVWGGDVGAVTPFSVKDGAAWITSRRTPPSIAEQVPFRVAQNKAITKERYPFISGVLTTQLSFWYKYGYAEAELKLPAGHGLWPAFWLLPKEWPYSPEIDIMEAIGQEPRKTHYNVIAGEPGKPLPGVGIFADRGQDLTRGWHTFGCLWTPRFLEFFIDRKSIAAVPAHPTIDKCHYYLILNLAVGGKWPGPPSAATPEEASFGIKSVRVWQEKRNNKT